MNERTKRLNTIANNAVHFVVSAVLLQVSLIWIIVGVFVISFMTLKTTTRLFELVKRSTKKTSYGLR